MIPFLSNGMTLFEMIKMKKKIAKLRNQLQLNKIKFKKTSTEWTLENILNSFKGQVSSTMVIEFPKLAIIVSVTRRGHTGLRYCSNRHF